MEKEFAKLAKKYLETCKNCGKIKYIPKKYEYCLDCARKNQNLQSWETICLQCGKKTGHLKGGNKFCWTCIYNNIKKYRKEFLASLNKEQKMLFEQYEKWSNAYTSIIILD